jgi:hypothetical protein
MKTNQKGFSAVEGLLIFVVVGLIGFVGWYVWHSKNSTKNSSTTSSTTSTQPTTKDTTPKKEEFKLPEGYISYKSSSPGFSMAYPKDWGDLAAPTDSNLGYTAATKYIDNKTIGDSWLQGYFGYSLSDKSTFKISTKKYGATVAPTKSGSGYTWKVVEVNPADTTDKVGDTYTVKTLTSTSGVTLYDFSWQDEGATHSTFVFEANNKFVTVSLPAILRQFMDTVSAKDMDLYNTIAKNIQSSVALTE